MGSFIVYRLSSCADGDIPFVLCTLAMRSLVSIWSCQTAQLCVSILFRQKKNEDNWTILSNDFAISHSQIIGMMLVMRWRHQKYSPRLSSLEIIVSAFARTYLYMRHEGTIINWILYSFSVVCCCIHLWMACKYQVLSLCRLERAHIPIF